MTDSLIVLFMSILWLQTHQNNILIQPELFNLKQIIIHCVLVVCPRHKLIIEPFYARIKFIPFFATHYIKIETAVFWCLLLQFPHASPKLINFMMKIKILIHFVSFRKRLLEQCPDINIKTSMECERARVRVCETTSEIICKVVRLRRPPMPWHLECGLACGADAQSPKASAAAMPEHSPPKMGNKSSLGINFLADCGERWKSASSSRHNL